MGASAPALALAFVMGRSPCIRRWSRPELTRAFPRCNALVARGARSSVDRFDWQRRRRSWLSCRHCCAALMPAADAGDRCRPYREMPLSLVTMAFVSHCTPINEPLANGEADACLFWRQVSVRFCYAGRWRRHFRFFSRQVASYKSSTERFCKLTIVPQL